MKAIKLFLSILLPAIVNGLLESTLSEEGLVPDEEVPSEEIGFERQLQFQLNTGGPGGLTSVRFRGKGSRRGKGSKGKGGSSTKGTKGSKGGVVSPQCDTYRVYYLREDYRENLGEITTSKGSKGQAIGFTVDRLDLFDARTNRVVGFVTETNLITGEFDCTASGALSFNESPNGRSRDQIFYQGTCSTQVENAVTGGTGAFTCAVGTARVLRRTQTRVFIEVGICGVCG